MPRQHVDVNFDGQTLNALSADDEVFVRCSFHGTTMEGAMISGSTFVECRFVDADLYWCMAFRARFIRCRFERADLRGNLAEAAFIDCVIRRSNFGADNLGGKPTFDDVVFIDCDQSGNTDFPGRSA